MSTLIFSGVSFAHPGAVSTEPLFSRLDLSVGSGLSSLVGRNGSGKSTLLRLAAGTLQPNEGAISWGGDLPGSPTVAYLPQLLGVDSGTQSLAEILGIADMLAALDRIEAGHGTEADFDTVGTDWSCGDRAVAMLDSLGLPTDVEREAASLSGGERTLAALAGLLLSEPDVLLLDEPTNNLDSAARSRLFSALDTFVAGHRRIALVVSHDLELLERVNTTIELRDGRCHIFGGPYSLYREAVNAQQSAAVRERDEARNTLRAEQRDRVEAVEKASRRAAQGRRVQAAGGLPRILVNARRKSAQESAGRLRAVANRGVDQARERLNIADGAVRRDDLLRIELPDPELPAGRVVIDWEDTAGPTASRTGRIHLLGPERLRLAGANGSGKSTLLRRLIGADGTSGTGSTAGSVAVAGSVVGSAAGPVTGSGGLEQAIRVPWALVPQDLSVAHPEDTVVQAIRAVRPESEPQEVHAHAAHMLFSGDEGHRQLGTLSGGERLRAVLAMRLFARPIPQLLMLDEPTNNLDVEGVEVLAAALADWRGALLLVSHDDGFCDRVGVGRTITLRTI